MDSSMIQVLHKISHQIRIHINRHNILYRVFSLKLSTGPDKTQHDNTTSPAKVQNLPAENFLIQNRQKTFPHLSIYSSTGTEKLLVY